MPVETEIKLRLDEGAEAARELLAHHGFYVVLPRELEIDQVYDFPAGDLRRSARLLRLRQSRGKCTVTFKGPPGPGPHKSREEIETTVADGAAFAAILLGLGYVPSFRYEKYRTTFRAASGTGAEAGLVTLDETPIGDFLELEGPGYWIDATAPKLGFAEAQYITRSYAALYFEYLMTHPTAPSNMTFSGVV